MSKWWSLLFGIVMIAAVGIFVVAPFVGWWLPKNVASFGAEVDNLFYLILAITGFFFILTEAILVYNMYAFAAREEQKAYYTHGHHSLEMFWTAVPAVILLILAFVQIGAWERIKYQSRMPAPDQLFEVSARQFEWRIRYPAASQLDVMVKSWNENKPKPAQSWSEAAHADDIHVANELHVWQGANVRIFLKTKDVIHSFYLPNLRLKQDALPGKTIPVWFQVIEYNTSFDKEKKRWADGYDPKAGTFGHKEQIWDVVCAELCGWGHYKMIGRLYVHKDKEDFHKWLEYARKKQNETEPGENTPTAAR